MKETRLFIRVSQADKDLFLMGARKSGMTLTEFIRMAASYEAMKYGRKSVRSSNTGDNNE